jgi:hypothetical protein
MNKKFDPYEVLGVDRNATDGDELLFYDHITRKITAQSPMVARNETSARNSTGPPRMIVSMMIFFIAKLRSKAASLRQRSK